MKLAGFGSVVVAAGLITGIDGLLISGGVWIATGLLLRVLIRSSGGSQVVDAGIESEVGRIDGGESRAPRLGVPGMFLLLVSGLGSIAIGILGVGFSDDHEILRWFPFVVGVLITVIGLTAIPVEMGAIKAEDSGTGTTATDSTQENEADERDPQERLERLEDLLRRGLVTTEEYEAQRDRILRSI